MVLPGRDFPTAPGSLTADEIYAAVAWILVENRIIDSATVIDAASLPRVRMPARDRFVPAQGTPLASSIERH